jgi:ornithine carbamoyltransferase
MSVDLRKRSLLSITDLSSAEFQHLIDLSGELKRAKASRQEKPRLMGRNMALIFEKTSTRTRCSFEVAAFDQGMHVTYLDHTGSQSGHKESIKERRVLGRYYDCIEYRGYSGPWWSAGVACRRARLQQPDGRPSPAADAGRFHDDGRAWQKSRSTIATPTGRARNNMGNSLPAFGLPHGRRHWLVAPSLWPEAHITRRTAAERTGAHALTEDVAAGVRLRFIPPDVWLHGRAARPVAGASSSCCPTGERRRDEAAENRVRFMHCLPAFQAGDEDRPRLSEKYGLTALEVTEEVFESDASVAFDQAENRLHTTKALLVATLAD